MKAIFHHFPINAKAEKIFRAVSTSEGLDCWWSKKTTGHSVIGEKYHFYFGPEYNWTAAVTKLEKNKAIEFTFEEADDDWNGTKVGFLLIEKDDHTAIQFYHSGWKEDNEHFRISNFCWAMYLRLLKKYVESGEKIVYEDRLNV